MLRLIAALVISDRGKSPRLPRARSTSSPSATARPPAGWWRSKTPIRRSCRRPCARKATTSTSPTRASTAARRPARCKRFDARDRARHRHRHRRVRHQRSAQRRLDENRADAHDRDRPYRCARARSRCWWSGSAAWISQASEGRDAQWHDAPLGAPCPSIFSRGEEMEYGVPGAAKNTGGGALASQSSSPRRRGPILPQRIERSQRWVPGLAR